MKEWLNFLIPKAGKRPKKPRKPLPRSKAKIATKSRFKAQSNVFKQYTSKRSPKQVREFAARCQQQRLCNPTAAENRMEEILRGLGIHFTREFVLMHSDSTRFVLLDFWLPMHKIAIECDGQELHARQKNYDAGRDAFLKSHGIRTLRFDNSAVLKTPAATAERVLAILQRGGS